MFKPIYPAPIEFHYSAQADPLAGWKKQIKKVPKCADCGEPGAMTGHQECQYPQDH
jgi:hypothetical protein